MESSVDEHGKVSDEDVLDRVQFIDDEYRRGPLVYSKDRLVLEFVVQVLHDRAYRAFFSKHVYEVADVHVRFRPGYTASPPKIILRLIIVIDRQAYGNNGEE